MATDSKTAEDRLDQLGIKLLTPPEPFGTYAEAVQTGNLLTRRFSRRLAPIIVRGSARDAHGKRRKHSN